MASNKMSKKKLKLRNCLSLLPTSPPSESSIVRKCPENSSKEDVLLESETDGLLEEGIFYCSNYELRTGKIFLPGLQKSVEFGEVELDRKFSYGQALLGDAVKVEFLEGRVKSESCIRVVLGLHLSPSVIIGNGVVTRVTESHCAVLVEQPREFRKVSILAPRFAFHSSSLKLEPSLLNFKVHFLALPSNPNPKYRGTPLIFSIY